MIGKARLVIKHLIMKKQKEAATLRARRKGWKKLGKAISDSALEGRRREQKKTSLRKW